MPSLLSKVASRLVPTCEPPSDPPRVPDIAEETSDDAHLLNLISSGWYNAETHELAPGLPITAADRVVDVGCGGGGASIFATQRGAEVVAVDVNPTAIEKVLQKAREEFGEAMGAVPERPLRAMLSDCRPIPLPDGFATVVLAMEVLEHVDDPGAFLSELARIGGPGSRYLLSVPDPLSEAAYGRVGPARYWSKPNHVRVFERDEFQRTVEAAGLMVEQRTFCGFYWSMWWILRWADPNRKVPFGKSADSPVLRHWNRTWKTLLTSPRGQQVREALDNSLPKSQVIIARKPA